MIAITTSVPFGTNISFISDFPSADFIDQRRGSTASLRALCKSILEKEVKKQKGVIVVTYTREESGTGAYNLNVSRQIASRSGRD